MIKVLFVCLGNICRSPMAEAVFKHLVEEAGLSDQFHIDSVATSSYHIGEPAHRGTRRVLARHNILCDNVARRVTLTDLNQADYIVAMDYNNISNVRTLARDIPLDGRLSLLLDYADNPPTREVPDPYYEDNFEYTYQLVKAGCEGLLEHIRQKQGV